MGSLCAAGLSQLYHVRKDIQFFTMVLTSAREKNIDIFSVLFAVDVHGVASKDVVSVMSSLSSFMNVPHRICNHNSSPFFFAGIRV